MKTDLFQSCGHCWVFHICWHIDCNTSQTATADLKKRERDYFRLSWRANVLTVSLNMKEAGGKLSVSDTRWERLNQPLLDLTIKEAATSQGLQAVYRNWKRQGNRFSHGASRGTTALLNILILAHSRPTGISDLQNFKIIYLCCFKPLSLWSNRKKNQSLWTLFLNWSFIQAMQTILYMLNISLEKNKAQLIIQW